MFKNNSLFTFVFYLFLENQTSKANDKLFQMLQLCKLDNRSLLVETCALLSSP